MRLRMDRRQWLKTSLATAVYGGLATSGSTFCSGNAPEASFRFVHLTDIHVQPELRAAEGLAACLEAVERLAPKPDFILTGGDLIMDALGQTAERSLMQFDLLLKTFSAYSSLPVYHCIGNHDVFGWQKKFGVSESHPQYGKKMYCEKLSLEKTYYYFDHKGWRFYVLDTILPSTQYTYEGGLDEEQWDWLRRELQSKPSDMPAVVVGHIPFLTVTVMPDAVSDGRFVIPAPNVCRNGQQAALLFAQYNVRLALSGHIHMVDRVSYRGVEFICGGAVSGGWWKGPNKGFEEGFGIIDLEPTGRVQYTYFDYGWRTE